MALLMTMSLASAPTSTTASTGFDWTAVGGLAAAVTGIVAIRTLVHAANDSRERSRPVIVAEYRIPERAYKRMDLVVRNAGPSVARDIDVTFDPSLGTLPLMKSGPELREAIVVRYGRRIDSLGPGHELTNIVSVDLAAQGESDLPLDVTVTVSYRRSRRRRYEEKYRLDAVMYAQHSFSTQSDSPLGQLTAIRQECRSSPAHPEGRTPSRRFSRSCRPSRRSCRSGTRTTPRLTTNRHGQPHRPAPARALRSNLACHGDIERPGTLGCEVLDRPQATVRTGWRSESGVAAHQGWCQPS
ncbi:hypothetical protein ACFQ8T_04410 [Isoptericola sp. NPDC056618]|uniref:hypothetical protein n=1 Tax=Isoptericola sp. NPDC056618 TaxID=3345878 RepID=UPI00369E3C7D